MKLTRQQIAVICITVALLVVVGTVILTVAGVYTDGFKTEFRHFYVSSGRTKYLQDKDVVLGDVKFNVHFVLKKNVGYTVQVLPAGEAVGFLLDGQLLEYTSAVKDVTEAFDVKVDGKRFTLRCRDKSLQEVLETMFPGQTVQIPNDNVDSDLHYKLVVTAGDGSQRITLTFRCLFGVTDVEVPPELFI